MKKLRKSSFKRSESDTVDDPLSGDLTDFIQDGNWQVAKFELSERKDKVISLRLSDKLLTELKKQAIALGLDTQKFIRIILESIVRKRLNADLSKGSR